MDTLAILLSDTYKQVHHNMFPRGSLIGLREDQC